MIQQRNFRNHREYFIYDIGFFFFTKMPLAARSLMRSPMQQHIISPFQQLPNFLFQPQPKQYATHCYIAQNLNYHRQFARLNPFYGFMQLVLHHCLESSHTISILNVGPLTELALLGNTSQGNLLGNDLSSLQDKDPGSHYHMKTNPKYSLRMCVV